MKRLASTLALLAAAALGCSGESETDRGQNGGQSGTAAGGTSAGGSSGATTGGSAGTTGGSGAGGAAGTGIGGDGMGGASATGGTTTGGSAGTGQAGAGGGATVKTGICGQRGEATANEAATYDGFEEFYMISEEAVDDGRTNRCLMEGGADCFICVIRFDVTRVGEAIEGCMDLDGMPCEWSHRVAYGNPTVVTDIDGACAASQIAWDAAWIASIDGTEENYGFVDQYSGHDSVLMRYDDMAMLWNTHGRATWEPTTSVFTFDNRIGSCWY